MRRFQVIIVPSAALVFFVASIILFCEACQKPDALIPEDNSEINVEVTPRFGEYNDSLNCNSSAISNVSFTDSLLVFDDFVHFWQVVSCLEDAVDSHQAFVDSLALASSLQGDSLEAYIDNYLDSIGYGDWEPLEDFEDMFSGFSSRRDLIETNIENWLTSYVGSIDWDDDPDELDDLSEEERTLININGFVQVGDTIFN